MAERPAPDAAGAFRWPVRVYYEDTDSGGLVYYASYLRFMERARTEWLRALGYAQSRLRAEAGVLFTVARLEIAFLAPGRFDDLLAVTVRLARAGGASLSLAQEVVRDPADLLCRATVRIACVDAASLRPRSLPPILRTELGA